MSIPWNKGKKMSLKMRQKMRILKLGNKNRLGKTHSQQTKDKISASKVGKTSNRKGVTLSQETRLKISKNKRGVSVHTAEQKEKWSINRKGVNNPAWINGRSYNKKIYRLERRKREAEAPGFHSEYEWNILKAQYGYRCLACKREEPNIKLTKDHIIPLAKGGSHFIENIQPLCQSCNSKKKTKIINYIIT